MALRQNKDFSMKRATLINLHLYFSGLSTFILLLFIISGSLHLYGFKETKTSVLVKVIKIQSPLTKKTLEAKFKGLLETEFPKYRFDYIKGSSRALKTRPTTREYFTLENRGSSLGLIKHSPNFTMKLMEFHKGHGPRSSRKLLATISIIFALAIVTGIWLGLTVKKYKRITLLTSLSGLALVLIMFSL